MNPETFNTADNTAEMTTQEMLLAERQALGGVGKRKLADAFEILTKGAIVLDQEK